LETWAQGKTWGKREAMDGANRQALGRAKWRVKQNTQTAQRKERRNVPPKKSDKELLGEEGRKEAEDEVDEAFF